MTEKPIQVFFSYSHRDEEFKDELVKHLSILQYQGVISGWHDRMIAPGSEWDRAIDAYLSSAEIILLMVSPDFLASDYCWGVEVQKAMQRHEVGEACVIPVVLRWVDWAGAPFAKFQALPKNAKPIASWSDRDEAFYDVVRGIAVAVENLLKAQQQKPEAEQQAAERMRLKAEERKRQQEERQAKLQQQTEARQRHEAEPPPWKLKYLLLAGGACGVIWGAFSLIHKPQSPNQPAQTFTAAQMTAEDLFKRALEKQNRGDNKGAIADYDQAIKLKSDYADAYYGRGLARYNLSDKHGAIADYDQAIKLKSDYADVYYGRGLARSDLGDKHGAIADYDQAIKLKSDYAEVYNNRGNARYNLGDKQGAIADYDESLRLNNPMPWLVYNNRGNARSALGDKQVAIADYDQAIKLKPDYAEAYIGRGNARSALGDKQVANADFQKAVDLYKQQGNSEWYKKALDQLKKLRS
jgi:tetratricopeptide (TPR) repeat protein